MPTSALNTFDGDYLVPYYPEGVREIPVKLPANATYVAGQVLGELFGTNEIVTVTISGSPTGGDFTLTFGGDTTAAIAIYATNQTIQNALEALDAIGDGNVRVTSDWNAVGCVIRIEFAGTLAATNVGAVTCDVSGLTGGSAAQAVAVTQAGATGTPGTYKAFDNDGVTGEQYARAILKYDCTVDGSGNITVGGGEHGQTSLTAPAYVSGCFSTADLTGLNETSIAQLGRLISGTVSSGVLQMR